MKEASSNLTQEITKMRAAQIEEDLNETTFQMKERVGKSPLDKAYSIVRISMLEKTYSGSSWALRTTHLRREWFIQDSFSSSFLSLGRLLVQERKSTLKTCEVSSREPKFCFNSFLYWIFKISSSNCITCTHICTHTGAARTKPTTKWLRVRRQLFQSLPRSKPRRK